MRGEEGGARIGRGGGQGGRPGGGEGGRHAGPQTCAQCPPTFMHPPSHTLSLASTLVHTLLPSHPPHLPTPFHPLPLSPLRRDFNAFVRACEKFGRAAVPAIAAEIEGKTESEVRQYSVVFWQRNKELADWEKVWGANPEP